MLKVQIFARRRLAMKILLADDNPEVRSALVDALDESMRRQTYKVCLPIWVKTVRRWFYWIGNCRGFIRMAA